MEEKEKYWTQRISKMKFQESLTVCDAVIWKSKPGTLRINVSKATNGKFKKSNGLSICVRNGKVDLFYQRKTAWRNGNFHFDTKIPGIGGSKAYNALLVTINHFLAKNGMPKLPTNKIRAAIRARKKEKKAYFYLKKERSSWSRYSKDESLLNLYNEAVTSELKKALREYIYPVTSIITENMGEYVEGMPSLLRKKEFNLDEWAKFAVGKKTKKIVKLMRQSIEDRHFFRFVGALRSVRGLVALDHLYTLNDRLFTTSLTRKGVRPFMLRLNEAKRLSVLNSLKDEKSHRNNAFYFKDAIDQWMALGKIEIPAEYKNIKDIHDWLAEEYRKSKTVSREIPYTEKFKVIDGATMGDLRLELPKETEDLYTYGKKLSHCVASYGDMAVNKICQIFAVYRGEELLYNLEIRGKEIRQFRGKYNKNPDEGDKELVVSFLKQAGIAQ